MATFRFTDKSVSATYYNMARDNFHQTMVEILSKVGVKGEMEQKIDNQLDELQKDLENPQKESKFKLSNEKQVKLRKLLFEHFPILGPIMASVLFRNLNKSDNKQLQTKKSNVVDGDVHDVSLSECLKVLVVLAKCLTDTRNYFTHYNPFNSQEALCKMYERQKKVSAYLDQVFTASRRINKNRKGLTSVEMQFITSEAYKALKDDNDHFILDEKGRKKIGKNRDYYFSIVGESFIHKEDAQFIQKVFDGVQIFEADSKNNALSDFGLLYLCSCFISRHYARLFVDKAGLFTHSPYSRINNGVLNQATKENNIILEMLSIYRIRMFKGNRLDIHDTKTSIALDMLNELNRCPMPLYEHLSPEGKMAFEDKVTRPNENTPDVSLRLRHTDRFPTLALKMIDATDILPKIRFQVQLGTYRFRFYEKDCIDGNRQLRCLSKEINGFGRLQDIEELRKRVWENTTSGEQEENKIQVKEYVSTLLEDEETTLDLLQPLGDKPGNNPYITDHQASYNIHNNRIGLYWESTNPAKNHYLCGNGLTYLPTLNYKVVDSGGKILQKADIDQPSPLCSLSTYELGSLLFYHFIYKTYGGKKLGMRTAEQIIIDKYNNLIRFFKEIEAHGRSSFYATVPGKKTDEELQMKLDDYALSISEIPDKLRIYLRNMFVTYPSSTSSKLVGERLVKVYWRLQHFKEDRKKIGDKDNKYAKKGYADIRHGQIARYLAESIVDWLPEAARARTILTGLNFNKLQAALATFDGSEGHQFSDIQFLMRQAHLLSQECEGEGLAQVTIEGHPFLNQIIDMNPQNIEVFYSRYLEHEKRHLTKFLEVEVYNKKNNSYKYLPIDNRYIPTGKEVFTFKDDIDLRAIPFIHPNRDKWKKRNDVFCKQLAKRYQEHIELPDGLFTREVIKLLRLAPECEVMFDNGFKEEDCNMSHLVNLYLERVLKDQSQSYYGLGDKRFYRSYRLFDILYGKVVRNEQLPYYLSCDEIMEKIGSKEGRNKVKKEIDSLVARMTNRDRGNCKTLEEAKKKKEDILVDAINQVKKNEKTIRRFKTQDIILFLIAKQVLIQTDETIKNNAQSQSEKFVADESKTICLGSTNPISYEQKEDLESKHRSGLARMRLADVFEGDSLNIPLDQTYYHTISWILKDSDGNEVKDAKGSRIKVVRTVRITQEDMSIKNYGRIFQILSDKRLDDLLKMLIQYVESNAPINGNSYSIAYNDVTSEFANFDHLRPEVFKEIHRLESEAFPKLEDKQSELTYSFNGLMGLLFQENAAKSIINIRNAFVHGSYRVNNIIWEGPDSQSAELVAPNVSRKMKDRISPKDSKETKY